MTEREKWNSTSNSRTRLLAAVYADKSHSEALLLDVQPPAGWDSIDTGCRLKHPKSTGLWVWEGYLTPEWQGEWRRAKLSDVAFLLDEGLRPVRRLVEAAKQMRDAVNVLWLAHNPEGANDDEIPLSEDEAQELHSEAFCQLERAEYYVKKEMNDG
jgi:hypothetical protein